MDGPYATCTLAEDMPDGMLPDRPTRREDIQALCAHDIAVAARVLLDHQGHEGVAAQ